MTPDAAPEPRPLREDLAELFRELGWTPAPPAAWEYVLWGFIVGLVAGVMVG